MKQGPSEAEHDSPGCWSCSITGQVSQTVEWTVTTESETVLCGSQNDRSR